MNTSYYYAISALFNGLFGAFVTYYVYLRNRSNPINQSFVFFGISVSGWSLIYSLWGFADSAELAEAYVRRHMMFEAFIPATLFHFTAHLTQNYKRLKKIIILIYLLSAAYSIGMLTPLMITGVKRAINFEYWPQPGVFLLSHTISFCVIVAWSFLLLIKRMIATTGRERQQVLWLFIGMAVGFGGGSINWFLWFDIPVPPTTNFFVGLMFVTTAYAMVRHGLMDVDTMVDILRSSRSATMGLVASSMNHELRNPLYIAKGKMESHLDAMERKIYKSETEELQKSRLVIKDGLAQLERAMDIMKKFSDFAKTASPAQEKEEINLKQVSEDVLGLLSNETELLKIKVVMTGLEGVSVKANRRHLEEILFNLMINACHAMGESGGIIRIRAEKLNGGGAVLEVEDNGPGISKEHIGRIFEPFYSTKGEKGSGLGLYITKQLVERNGGKISVKSKLGQGTIFRLEFKAQ